MYCILLANPIWLKVLLTLTTYKRSVLKVTYTNNHSIAIFCMLTVCTLAYHCGAPIGNEFAVGKFECATCRLLKKLNFRVISWRRWNSRLRLNAPYFY
ncbi:unnamed protein product [Blepharisma stoltei]|uniref:Secreted protein n=1 Tax=Blepharisma stoltei TaxID=1481888 RepID=A0AAU9ITZ7_9CILI|nr:unnamed protein product [Blepharisma stoltei]